MGGDNPEAAGICGTGKVPSSQHFTRATEQDVFLKDSCRNGVSGSRSKGFSLCGLVCVNEASVRGLYSEALLSEYL